MSRTTIPTAAQATPIATTRTSAAAAQLSHGSGTGSPGTSHRRMSSVLSPMPNPMPSGTAATRITRGSARPSSHSRVEETPRSEASASSGTRISLAAISSRISRASATSTSENTAGAIDVRAVDRWSRTSASTCARLLVSGIPTRVPRSTSSASFRVAAVATAAARSAGVASAGTSRGVSTRTLHA